MSVFFCWIGCSLNGLCLVVFKFKAAQGWLEGDLITIISMIDGLHAYKPQINSFLRAILQMKKAI